MANRSLPTLESKLCFQSECGVDISAYQWLWFGAGLQSSVHKMLRGQCDRESSSKCRRERPNNVFRRIKMEEIEPLIRRKFGVYSSFGVSVWLLHMGVIHLKYRFRRSNGFKSRATILYFSPFTFASASPHSSASHPVQAHEIQMASGNK